MWRGSQEPARDDEQTLCNGAGGRGGGCHKGCEGFDGVNDRGKERAKNYCPRLVPVCLPAIACAKGANSKVVV